LEPGTTPVPAAPPLTVLSSPEHVSSTLAPIIGSSVETSLFWPAPREDDADYWPLWVAADYLDRELYQTLRTERAESYSPTAMYVNYGEWALLQLYADGATGTEALLENGILEVLKKVSIGPIDANGFESVKMAILLGSASGFESNASFAGYYADRLPQLKGYGRYLDEESDIENVTPETMQAAVRRWLVPEKRLAAYEVPTMQQQTMVFLLIGVGAVLIVALGVSYRRLRVGRSS
jgi:predicted Zn-dependent peptidase